MKIGVIRVKVQFSEQISKYGLIKNIFYINGGKKHFIAEMQPNINPVQEREHLLLLET